MVAYGHQNKKNLPLTAIKTEKSLSYNLRIM